MSKPKQKFPKVFVGCSFKQPAMGWLKDELEFLPWKIVTGDTQIRTEHLLDKIERDLKTCDFAIFDITDWNPNVCLELGLARGLGIKYYITGDCSKKTDAPTDLRGIDRIQYNWKKWSDKNSISLSWEFAMKLFRYNYYTKSIWKEMEHSANCESKFYFACGVLSHFKNSNRSLSSTSTYSYSKGLYLKDSDRRSTLDLLCEKKLLRKVQKTGNLVLSRKLY